MYRDPFSGGRGRHELEGSDRQQGLTAPTERRLCGARMRFSARTRFGPGTTATGRNDLLTQVETPEVQAERIWALCRAE